MGPPCGRAGSAEAACVARFSKTGPEGRYWVFVYAHEWPEYFDLYDEFERMAEARAADINAAFRD